MSEERKRKIGIMGGTFDPIHIGHLILGEAARQQFSLDKVFFMPAGNPPHKRNRAGRAGDEQRVDMVRLAIASNPGFELSLFEMNEDGYSYTYRTLEMLRNKNPDMDFYFIMGADSLFDFDQWREPQRIVNAAHIVVATRNQTDPDVFNRLLDQRREEFHGDFLKLDTPNLDISSKHIRELIRNGISARYYLPDPVLDYIRENRIYLSSADNAEKVACSGKG
ncbi:nicotinate-nucleotide adenylyltransferase [Bilifractor sp. LCP19S3_H10]|uniref:nicotinate-nucleotide adenylyltransferase n=1 Tax=Bilifractor sp. LCP19S3_H10 TaxID=3438736 RepID=UPI003F911D87